MTIKLTLLINMKGKNKKKKEETYKDSDYMCNLSIKWPTAHLLILVSVRISQTMFPAY